MSCHVITLACRVMSWHVGMGGFWLSHLAISDNGSLQVRFHDDIGGSSLARAIYASTGPLLLPFDSGFPTRLLRNIFANTDVECIVRAKKHFS